MNRPNLALALTLLASGPALAFTDPKTGFSSTAPRGWKQSAYPGAAVVYLAPKRLGAFNPNITVLVQRVPAGTRLKEFNKVTVAQVRKFLNGARIISQSATAISGVPATRLVYTGKQNNMNFYFTQTSVVSGRFVYLLNGTTLQGQEATLAPVMAAFVKSFKIKR